MVTSKEELTRDELDEISRFISGQNSDGLGEGFSQQDFAEVDIYMENLNNQLSIGRLMSIIWNHIEKKLTG